MGSDNENPLNGLDYDAVMVWIDNYCAAHPLSKIKDAVVELNRAHPR